MLKVWALLGTYRTTIARACAAFLDGTAIAQARISSSYDVDSTWTLTDNFSEAAATLAPPPGSSALPINVLCFFREANELRDVCSALDSVALAV